MNISDCWICTIGPLHTGTGIPMIPIPFTRKEVAAWKYFDPSKGRVHIDVNKPVPEEARFFSLSEILGIFQGWHISTPPYNITRPYFIISQHVKGSICFCKFSDKPADALGYSDCLAYSPFISKHLMNGTYWVCGSRAFAWLPLTWGGCCYLAYTVPYLHHISRLQDHPSLMRMSPVLRHRRALSGAEIFFGALIPGYGVIRISQEVHKLYDLMSSIANETSFALSSVSQGLNDLNHELSAVRTVALQNRMALDFLLAKQGGTCAVVGSECCSYVPDVSTNVSDIVQHVSKSVRELQRLGIVAHNDSLSLGWNPFSWLTGTFGGLGHNILRWLLPLLLIFVLIIVLVSFFRSFCTQMLVRSRK
ncbi:endogenous retrovirus group PABLB member 1 Env polyprotein-like isoform X1 [Narcine bancroftii]|uniref:endogenous retrovirus group PABLB member 1 Env polyprotein-like isoform X1 n=1 Tax=Narcine bancroftii TaxID=1343680 RepID=UPI00383203B1